MVNSNNWEEFIYKEFSTIENLSIDVSYLLNNGVIKKSITTLDENTFDFNQKSFLIYLKSEQFTPKIYITVDKHKLKIQHLSFFSGNGDLYQEGFFNTRHPFNCEFVYDDYDLSNMPDIRIEFDEKNKKLVSSFLEIPKNLGWREEQWHLKYIKNRRNTCFRTRVTVVSNKGTKYISSNFMIPSYSLILTRLLFSISGMISYLLLLPLLKKEERIVFSLSQHQRL